MIIWPKFVTLAFLWEKLSEVEFYEDLIKKMDFVVFFGRWGGGGGGGGGLGLSLIIWD